MGEWVNAGRVSPKQKAWIYRSHFSAPDLGQLRLDRPVEGSVYLSCIEEASQVFKRMQPVPLHARRIENPFPVFVRPSGRANADLMREFHGETADGGQLKISTE